MLPFQTAAFRMLHSWRPVEDAVASLVCHGTLSRFPDLKVAVIENGSSWVEPLMKSLKDIYKKRPQDFQEDPVEQIKARIHVSPFWEEDLNALADVLGEDRVLFGSDYPHPEGLAEPRSYLAALEGASRAADRQDHGWQSRPADERGCDRSCLRLSWPRSHRRRRRRAVRGVPRRVSRAALRWRRVRAYLSGRSLSPSLTMKRHRRDLIRQPFAVRTSTSS